ncbi:MAG: hypothetical protein ACFCU8_06350 [Thermosynechococcaceae cyanobacterium]
MRLGKVLSEFSLRNGESGIAVARREKQEIAEGQTEAMNYNQLV